jgi:hypothetical protein
VTAPPAAVAAPPRRAVPADPVPVAGPVAAARFPDACASCGATPAGTLPIEKVFRRTDPDSPATYVYGRVDAPFCAGCLARHARELTPVDPAVVRRLALTWLARSLIYVVPIGCLVLLLADVAPGALRNAVREPSLRTLGRLVPAAFFGGLLAMLVTMALRARHGLMAGTWDDPDASYMRVVPALMGARLVVVGPPTSVVGSVDYTDDASELFDGERHVFTFRDPVIAAQFAAANAGRLWDGGSPAARRHARRRKALLVAVLAAGAGALLIDGAGSAVVRAVREFLPW